MSRLAKESLKTVSIFILVILGLLQVGVLWSYQNQGTPASFIFRIFNGSSQISEPEVRETLFVPDRLILSNGDKSHWIIDGDSEYYEDLWDEAKQGLISIVTGTAGIRLSGEEWGDVADKRGFVIDFSFDATPGLIKWFLGTGLEKQDLSGINKIMVRPDIVNKDISTFYILSTDNKVYVSDAIRYRRSGSINDIVESISDDEGQKQRYREYYSFRGGNIDSIMRSEPDVLYVAASPMCWRYLEYTAIPPVLAEDKEKLADCILGAEKDRYSKSSDGETARFSYGDNVYRYYEDGYLTYRYLGNADLSGRGNIGGALLNAYKLVDRIKEIMNPGTDIILSGATEVQTGVFNFTFDYRLKGMPVVIDVDTKDASGRKLENAISINADSKRVLKCDWLLRDFEYKTGGNFNDRFMDIARLSGMNYEDMPIRDMRAGYYVSTTGRKPLKPLLIIWMKDKPLVWLAMLSE